MFIYPSMVKIWHKLGKKTAKKLSNRVEKQINANSSLDGEDLAQTWQKNCQKAFQSCGEANKC